MGSGKSRPKSPARNIVVTPTTRPFLIWIIWRLTNEAILGRNPRNVPVARNGFKRSLISIFTWKRTTSELSSACSLVVHAAKHFTTALSTMLIFPLRIQLHSPLKLANDLLEKPQTHQLQNNPRGHNKQVRIQHQNQSTRQLLPLVLAGKWITFLSL